MKNEINGKHFVQYDLRFHALVKTNLKKKLNKKTNVRKINTTKSSIKNFDCKKITKQHSV